MEFFTKNKKVVIMCSILFMENPEWNFTYMTEYYKRWNGHGKK